MCREGWGSGAPNPAPPASWNCLSGSSAGEERSCLANLKEKFGSSCLPAGPPAESDCGGGRRHPGRCRSLGDFSRVLFLAGCGCTTVNEEQRLRTSQRGGAGMPKPAGRRQPNCWAGEREGKQSLLNESLQLLDGLMSVSDRLSGATLSPPDAVPRALGACSEVSLRLQRVRPQARQLVEMHQSV